MLKRDIERKYLSYASISFLIGEELMNITNTFNENGKTLNELLQELVSIYAYDLLENNG